MYVNEHLFEPISVQTVGNAFYCSTSQVAKLFRQTTGASLWEYVTVKRMLAARAMLQRGDPASTVCYATGYSDYSAFYRAYKKKFGCSPRENIQK